MAGRRRLFLVIVALLAAGLGALVQATDALRSLELETVDARFAIRSDDTVPRGVVVLGMDPDTFARFGRPPIPRRHHAEAIDALRAAGAAVIAYDLEFVGRTTRRDDERLLRAIRRAGNVVLASMKFFRSGGSPVLGSPRTVRLVRAQVGFAGFAADKGDVIRRVRGRVEGVPTFASLASGMPADAWIDYRGDVEVIPFLRAIDGRLPSLDGRTVVVGDVDPVGQDVHATPLGTRAGPEIQAIAIDTLQRGAPLRTLGAGWGYVLIVALGLVVPVAALFLSGLRWLPVAAAALAVWPVAVQLLFDGGRIAPFVPGLTAVLTGGLGTLVVAYATDLRERRRLRSEFSRFAPPSVVEALLQRSDGAPGVRREATVLFADLRGFTAVAERIGAEQVIELLNRYLSGMSDAILDHGGTVVSFMGDGIMAVFGAPVEQPDHADRALAAAREMLGPRLTAFNAGSDTAFAMGIGIASGPVMSGTVGSSRRVEYAAVGDTTNTAARLEAATKETGRALHVADSTRAALREPAGLVEAGELELRGKQGPVRVWTL